MTCSSPRDGIGSCLASEDAVGARSMQEVHSNSETSVQSFSAECYPNQPTGHSPRACGRVSAKRRQVARTVVPGRNTARITSRMAAHHACVKRGGWGLQQGPWSLRGSDRRGQAAVFPWFQAMQPGC